MKFYLLKDQPVPFIFTSTTRQDKFLVDLRANLFDANQSQNGSQSQDPLFNWKVVPFTENEPDGTKKCERLLELMKNNVASGDHNWTYFWKYYVEISVVDVLSSHTIMGQVKGELRFEAEDPEYWSVLDVLQTLSDGYGDAKVQILLEEVCDACATPLWKAVSEEMSFTGAITEAPTCTSSSFLVPMSLLKAVKEQKNVKVSVIASVPNEVLTGQVEGTSKSTTARNILKAQILTDVTLVADNGTEIPAHKAFLASQSAIFLAMFQTGMKEAQESVVELEDMSEESVKALLKYLYYLDIEDAVGSSGVAFELFCAAHKYDIGLLEETMRNLLLEKETTWFRPGLAVKIFDFARKLTPPDEPLKIKAVQVLKGHNTNLMDIPECKELFKDNYTAAMELCQISLQTCT